MINKLKTCRCCLTEFDSLEELYEFSSEFSLDDDSGDDFIKISECFHSLTTIRIPEDAEDENKICSGCLTDLKFCFVFLKKCQSSDDVYNNTDFEEQMTVFHVKSEATEYSECIEFIESENLNEDTTDGFVDESAMKGELDDSMTIESFVNAERQPKRTLPKTITRASTKNTVKQQSKSIKHEKGAIKQDVRVYNASHKCKKCPLTFSTAEEMKEHTKLHSSGEKSFPCDMCPKFFKNRYQLTLHVRSHTGEKPFVCELCDRAFSMSSNLQKHVDTHSTDKPYECKVCQQFFKTQRSLKFHTVCYHQPEVKVKCQQCDKSFVNKSYLKMHMLYHSGQKNYTCTICESKYYKSSHLKRHVQNVHMKLRLMKCEYCTSDFVRKETYKSHITSHHKKDMTEEEYENCLERIRKFQAPPLDIKKYTLEKQVKNFEDEEMVEEMEMIEEDSNAALEDEGEEEIYYEEEDL